MPDRLAGPASVRARIEVTLEIAFALSVVGRFEEILRAVGAAARGSGAARGRRGRRTISVAGRADRERPRAACPSRADGPPRAGRGRALRRRHGPRHGPLRPGRAGVRQRRGARLASITRGRRSPCWSGLATTRGWRRRAGSWDATTTFWVSSTPPSRPDAGWRASPSGSATEAARPPPRGASRCSRGPAVRSRRPGRPVAARWSARPTRPTEPRRRRSSPWWRRRRAMRRERSPCWRRPCTNSSGFRLRQAAILLFLAEAYRARRPSHGGAGGGGPHARDEPADVFRLGACHGGAGPRSDRARSR